MERSIRLGGRVKGGLAGAAAGIFLAAYFGDELDAISESVNQGCQRLLE